MSESNLKKLMGSQEGIAPLFHRAIEIAVDPKMLRAAHFGVIMGESNQSMTIKVASARTTGEIAICRKDQTYTVEVSIRTDFGSVSGKTFLEPDKALQLVENIAHCAINHRFDKDDLTRELENPFLQKTTPNFRRRPKPPSQPRYLKRLSQ